GVWTTRSRSGRSHARSITFPAPVSFIAATCLISPTSRTRIRIGASLASATCPPSGEKLHVPTAPGTGTPLPSGASVAGSSRASWGFFAFQTIPRSGRTPSFAEADGAAAGATATAASTATARMRTTPVHHANTAGFQRYDRRRDRARPPDRPEAAVQVLCFYPRPLLRHARPGHRLLRPLPPLFRPRSGRVPAPPRAPALPGRGGRARVRDAGV